jgi:hypothetical protein
MFDHDPRLANLFLVKHLHGVMPRLFGTVVPADRYPVLFRASTIGRSAGISSARTSLISSGSKAEQDPLGRDETPKDLPYDRPARIFGIDQVHVIPDFPSYAFPSRLSRPHPVFRYDPQSRKLVLFVIMFPTIRRRAS